MKIIKIMIMMILMIMIIVIIMAIMIMMIKIILIIAVVIINSTFQPDNFSTGSTTIYQSKSVSSEDLLEFQCYKYSLESGNFKKKIRCIFACILSAQNCNCFRKILYIKMILGIGHAMSEAINQVSK